jgi:hypothetical protein
MGRRELSSPSPDALLRTRLHARASIDAPNARPHARRPQFERDAHYLKDAAGVDIEPVGQFTTGTPAPTYSKRWGKAIGAGFLVNLCTFIGVLFLIPGLSQLAKKYFVPLRVISLASGSPHAQLAA